MLSFHFGIRSHTYVCNYFFLHHFIFLLDGWAQKTFFFCFCCFHILPLSVSVYVYIYTNCGRYVMGEKIKTFSKMLLRATTFIFFFSFQKQYLATVATEVSRYKFKHEWDFSLAFGISMVKSKYDLIRSNFHNKVTRPVGVLFRWHLSVSLPGNSDWHRIGVVKFMIVTELPNRGKTHSLLKDGTLFDAKLVTIPTFLYLQNTTKWNHALDQFFFYRSKWQKTLNLDVFLNKSTWNLHECSTTLQLS